MKPNRVKKSDKMVKSKKIRKRVPRLTTKKVSNPHPKEKEIVLAKMYCKVK